MNVMIDTNVILDDILSREPHRVNAGKIMELVTGQQILGYITANTLTDIYYLIEKHRGWRLAREAVKKILRTLQIIAVNGDDCERAIYSPMLDFEDALVVFCAAKAELDYIVTNDRGFLADTNLLVPAINPADFLKVLDGTY